MDHLNSGLYQLLKKKDSTTLIKANTLKQLKVLKDNKLIDNKLYYYLTYLNVKDENNNAKISTTFSKYIKNVPNEDDGIMVLFDIT